MAEEVVPLVSAPALRPVQSDKIDLLAAALVAAQGELENPPKAHKANIVSARTGGKFSYAYADLADVSATIRPVLSKNGLAILHQMVREPSDKSGYVLIAKLLHKSGQWLDSTYPVPGGLTAQDLGSWLTYMRRYSACNLCFVAGETEDDDAAGGVTKVEEPAQADPEKKRVEELQKKAAGHPPAESRKSAYDGRTLKPGEDPLPKEKEKPEDALKGVDKRLIEVMKADSVTPEKLAAFCSKHIGKTPMSQWSGDYVEQVVAAWPTIKAKIQGGK
jgi:hypothetical protein